MVTPIPHLWLLAPFKGSRAIWGIQQIRENPVEDVYRLDGTGVCNLVLEGFVVVVVLEVVELDVGPVATPG